MERGGSTGFSVSVITLGLNIMTGPKTCCCICQGPVLIQPLHCSECSDLGFLSEPICSLECLKRAGQCHQSLHRARPDPPAGISPVWRSSCGRCLIATADFNPGDVVLCEDPILYGTWSQCNSQFNSLSAEEQIRILAFSAADDEELIEDAERIAKKQIKPEEYTSQTTDLIQILHNNSIDISNGDCALFEFGSLIAHSCQPNVDAVIEDSRWVVRALLPIQAGDILGWNYNLSAKSVMEGTGKRRADMLDLRGFICACRLCQSVDYLRSFPCPNCEKGIIAGVYQGTLSCSKCALVISDSELEDFERNERTLYLEMKDADVDWISLSGRAWNQLGPHHGITGRACLEAAASLAPDHPLNSVLTARIRTFLSSPSMINAVLVHDYIRERIPSLTLGKLVESN